VLGWVGFVCVLGFVFVGVGFFCSVLVWLMCFCMLFSVKLQHGWREVRMLPNRNLMLLGKARPGLLRQTNMSSVFCGNVIAEPNPSSLIGVLSG